MIATVTRSVPAEDFRLCWETLFARLCSAAVELRRARAVSRATLIAKVAALATRLYRYEESCPSAAFTGAADVLAPPEAVFYRAALRYGAAAGGTSWQLSPGEYALLVRERLEVLVDCCFLIEDSRAAAFCRPARTA